MIGVDYTYVCNEHVFMVIVFWRGTRDAEKMESSRMGMLSLLIVMVNTI